jgi:myo-inositol-1(or 4)-monophosphatase
MMPYAGHPGHVDTKRSEIDLVTKIDKKSEAIIHKTINRAFPSHGFQGEEKTFANQNSVYRWIVDPIDGTTNFVHGVPSFAVSIGLTFNKNLIVGLVYDPARKEAFSAIKGKGSYLNGKRIHASSIKDLDKSLLSTGFSSKFRQDPVPYLTWFTAFQFKCHAVRRMGATSLSLAYVACGRQEGFYEQDLWPWDIAAGLLLVKEAGGKTTDFFGKPVDINEGKVVASNSLIHAQMLKVLSASS